MNNNKNLTDSDNVVKAQAELSPGLSSISKEMKNGVDIQPLDDIKAGEYVEFEDNVVENIATEENKETEELSVDKKFVRKMRLIQLSIIAVLIVSVIIGIYMAFFHSDDFTHSAVAIYEKNSAVNIMLENDDVLTLDNVSQIQLSDDGNILVYSQDTASKTGKYDIRVIDFSKRSSVKNYGSIIVSGIDSNWTMDNNGDFVYYQKKESGSTKYYAYSTQKSETKLIVADASDFFTPPKGDIVYYTRESSDNTILYRIRFGEDAESLGEVSNIKAVKDKNVLEIFYTIPNEDVEKEDFTLYKISGDSEKIKISDNVSEVYLDNYIPGGNLYYFVKNDAKLNWSDFIQDSYADSDASAEKPDKGDYLVTIGFIFKRTKLDETAYNRAMESYNKTLKRQEIREALNKLDLDLAVTAEYKVKAYDGQISKELASSVKLENLIAFAETGAPRIIYKTSGINSQKVIDMSSLYEIAVTKTVDDAMDYVIDCIEDDYEISTGCKYSWYDGNKVSEYDFDPECNISKAQFSFAGRNTIVTAVTANSTQSNLFISTVGNKEISKPVSISNNVMSFETESDKIYYTKQNGNNTDLYVCDTGGKSSLICENNVQYFVNSDESVILFKGVYDGKTLASVDIISFKDGETETIDTNASFKHFLSNGSDFAYIKDYKTAAASDTEATVGGELTVYSQGKTHSIDNDVSSIYSINFNN